jgi:hypothetical protein
VERYGLGNRLEGYGLDREFGGGATDKLDVKNVLVVGMHTKESVRNGSAASAQSLRVC